MEKFTPKPESIYSGEVVKKYYEAVGKDAEGGEYKTEADRYFESLIPESFEGKTVLDHGCGNGRYSELFCQRGAEEVLGVDLSHSMVQKAKERKEEKSLKQFEVVNGDINNLPTGERKFDFAFSRFSLVYSTDIDKVMRELSDTLKEGGEVLIETNVAYIKDHEKEIKNKFVPIILKFGDLSVPVKNVAIDLDQYLKSFKEAGFKVEIEKEYPPKETSVDPDYKYKDAVSFKTLIVKLIKSGDVAV